MAPTGQVKFQTPFFSLLTKTRNENHRCWAYFVSAA